MKPYQRANEGGVVVTAVFLGISAAIVGMTACQTVPLPDIAPDAVARLHEKIAALEKAQKANAVDYNRILELIGLAMETSEQFDATLSQMMPEVRRQVLQKRNELLRDRKRKQIDRLDGYRGKAEQELKRLEAEAESADLSGDER